MNEKMTRAEIEKLATLLWDGVIEIPTRMCTRKYDLPGTEVMMADASEAITQLMAELDVVLAREAATTKRYDDKLAALETDCANADLIAEDSAIFGEEFLAPPDAAQADCANALRAGWMMGVEAAATWVESGWNELPMRQEIASAIRALTPPDGDEVAWAARVLLADIGHKVELKQFSVGATAFFGGECPHDLHWSDVYNRLQSIAGGGK